MSGFSPEVHGREVSGMFARIAGRYDFLNHLLSGGLDFLWRRRLVRAAGFAPGSLILDLATGTFDVAIGLSRAYPAARVLAADLCLPMLRRGLPKIVKNGAGRVLHINPLTADALALPFRDAGLDCITVAFGLRNMRPRSAALAEAYRALRPGGRLCVLEFGGGHKKIWFGLYDLYLDYALPLLGRIFSGDGGAYGYLASSIRAFPPAGELADEMRAAGFSGVEYEKLCSGAVYLHCAVK